MREIKFRAKTYSKEFPRLDKWIEGTGIFFDGINTWLSYNAENVAIAFGLTHRLVHGETIGQFTGFKDKNGKEIYEGDILDYNDEVRVFDRGIVKFENGCFTCVGQTLSSLNLCTVWEVAGNIYENPELLGGKE